MHWSLPLLFQQAQHIYHRCSSSPAAVDLASGSRRPHSAPSTRRQRHPADAYGSPGHHHHHQPLDLGDATLLDNMTTMTGGLLGLQKEGGRVRGPRDKGGAQQIRR